MFVSVIYYKLGEIKLPLFPLVEYCQFFGMSKRFHRYVGKFGLRTLCSVEIVLVFEIKTANESQSDGLFGSGCHQNCASLILYN